MRVLSGHLHTLLPDAKTLFPAPLAAQVDRVNRIIAEFVKPQSHPEDTGADDVSCTPPDLADNSDDGASSDEEGGKDKRFWDKWVKTLQQDRAKISEAIVLATNEPDEVTRYHAHHAIHQAINPSCHPPGIMPIIPSPRPSTQPLCPLCPLWHRASHQAINQAINPIGDPPGHHAHHANHQAIMPIMPTTRPLCPSWHHASQQAINPSGHCAHHAGHQAIRQAIHQAIMPIMASCQPPGDPPGHCAHHASYQASFASSNHAHPTLYLRIPSS